MVKEGMFVINPHSLSPASVCLSKHYLAGSLTGISKINRHFVQSVNDNKMYANYIMNSTNEKIMNTKFPPLE